MRNKILPKAIVMAIAVIGHATVFAAECADECYPKRWVYWHGNPLSEDVTELTIKNLAQAAREAGFNGIAMSTGAIGSALRNDKCVDITAQDCSWSKIKRLVDAANAEGIEVIPVGGGPEIPAIVNPKLEEAFNVTVPYKVVGTIANRLEGAKNFIANGDFTNGVVGWGGEASWDSTTGDGDSYSAKIVARATPDKNGNYMARLILQDMVLDPNTPYQLSFSIMTDAMAEPKKDKNVLRVIVKNAPPEDNTLLDYRLGWSTLDSGEWASDSNTALFTPNNGWTSMNVQFNSGNPGLAGPAKAEIYIGAYGKVSKDVAIRIDNVKLQKIGISHPVEREGQPNVVVKSAAGATFKNDEDYLIKKSTLPGIVGNQIEFIPGKVSEGEVVTVSWRQPTVNLFTHYPIAIACDDGKFGAIQKTLWDRIEPLYANSGLSTVQRRKYFLYYDEMRAFNWENKKPGCSLPSTYDYLNRMVRGVQNALLVAPLETIVWHDMFDPAENAKERYYQVNGSLVPMCGQNACEIYDPARRNTSVGLRNGTIIANWAAGHHGGAEATIQRQKSLKYFKDFPQIASVFYDDSSPNLENMNSWLSSIDTSEDELNIQGFMYTTWKGDYTKLEAVAAKIRAHSTMGRKWPAVTP